ncbi:MAG: ATP-grasp domain-containing protein [Candidatus Melainabacteria bacterium]|jgi:biotin carboxylase|nr:ATP-grasp domain-containing protein [Candidatus Melainabacteria bacterium]
MKKITVWFNRGLSQTAWLVGGIRSSLQPGEELHIICTHTDPNAAVKEVADQFELEPTNVTPQEYVEWATEFAARNKVDVLIPHNYTIGLSAASDKFAAFGCKVIVAGDAATISLLKSKSELYDVVREGGGLGIEIPPYTLAADIEQVTAALRAYRERFGTLCFKPVKGLGGHGFRIVSDLGSDYPHAHNGDFPPLKMEEVEAYLIGEGNPLPEMMVMPYLNGPEYSVDCLAEDGVLVASVTRTKFPGGIEEVLDDKPDLVEQSAKLTELLKLSGLYNVQFLEADDGTRFLLEINARMAGGIHWGIFTGVLLPYWAIRLAAGTATPADIPQPKTGIRFNRKTRKVVG